MYVFPEQRQRPIRISALSRTSSSSILALLHSDHAISALQVGQTSDTSSLMLLRGAFSIARSVNDM
jgi:hypothetical protein